MAGQVSDERLTHLEAAVAALERSVHALESRLERLEQPSDLLRADDAEPLWTALLPFVGASRRDAASGGDAAVTITARVGGTLLALAGAYLLRALTESGSFSPRMGLAAGLTYALLWFALANRSRADWIASAVYGGIACTVAFPLVWEAATRFRLVGAGSAALLSAGIAGIALATAARRRLQPLAWFATLAALVIGLALVATTGRVLPFAWVAIALGILTLWLGYVRQWVLLRWPAALVADVMVIGATVRVFSGTPRESATRVAMLVLMLPAAYLVNIIVRTIVRRRDVIPFEVVQTIAALGVGIGCVSAIAGQQTFAIERVGWGTVALGGACYAASSLFVARRHGSRANVYFYSSIGLLLMLMGAVLLARDPTLPFAALAVGAAFAAASSRSPLPTLHAAIFAGAATAASGVLPFAADRFAGAAADWQPMTAPMLAAPLAAGLAFGLATRGAETTSVRVERVTMLVWFLAGASAWLVDVVAASVADASKPRDPAVIAAIGTAVIAAMAVLAAGLARSAAAVRDAGWLIYPLLVLGGAKLILQDLPHSRPSTLFVGLAVYGIALIVAPRLQAWRAPSRLRPHRESPRAEGRWRQSPRQSG
jgi:hypothetical protein